MLSREFFNPVSGACIFTVSMPQGFAEVSHYTYRIKYRPASDEYREAYFVGLLTGPNNEEDYTYLGMWDRERNNVFPTRASKYTRESLPIRLLNRVFERIFADDTEAILAAGFNVRHEGRCGICGKTLTVPESVQTGIGPICAKRNGQSD